MSPETGFKQKEARARSGRRHPSFPSLTSVGRAYGPRRMPIKIFL